MYVSLVSCTQFQYVSVEGWDSIRLLRYLQELSLISSLKDPIDTLLCFDIYKLNCTENRRAETEHQSHVCIYIDIDRDKDDWSVRLVDPAPTSRRIRKCRGDDLLLAMQATNDFFCLVCIFVGV